MTTEYGKRKLTEKMKRVEWKKKLKIEILCS